jgi:hypothetical protein
MNHLTAWAILVTAFSSGLYPIYRFLRSKYVSYDTTPIHYWSNKKQKIKKRYKTFKKHKANKQNKLTKYTKISKLNKKYIGGLKTKLV